LVFPPDDIPNVRKAMKSFVGRQMQAGDLAVDHDYFGRDGCDAATYQRQSRLYASIERVHYMPGRTGLTWYAPILPPGPDKKVQNGD